MAEIKTKIRDNKFAGVKEAFAGMFPIPMINMGTEEEPDMQPEFTKKRWVGKCIKRYVIKTTARWNKKQGNDSIPYVEDEEIIEE